MLRVGWGLSKCVFCTVEKKTFLRDHWVLDMYWVPFVIKNVYVCENCCWGNGDFLLWVCIYFIVRKWLWDRRLETVYRRLKPWDLKFSPVKICSYCFCDFFFLKYIFVFCLFLVLPFTVLKGYRTQIKHSQGTGMHLVLWYSPKTCDMMEDMRERFRVKFALIS